MTSPQAVFRGLQDVVVSRTAVIGYNAAPRVPR
jgi:hypothetical protein